MCPAFGGTYSETLTVQENLEQIFAAFTVKGNQLNLRQHISRKTSKIFYFYSCCFLNHESISIGNGKTMMDDFSDDISMSVCR
jgi:hypothetical protein